MIEFNLEELNKQNESNKVLIMGWHSNSWIDRWDNNSWDDQN